MGLLQGVLLRGPGQGDDQWSILGGSRALGIPLPRWTFPTTGIGSLSLQLGTQHRTVSPLSFCDCFLPMPGRGRFLPLCQDSNQVLTLFQAQSPLGLGLDPGLLQ